MQHFNVGNTSLVQDAGVKPVEIYIPLWFSNGALQATSGTPTTSGSSFFADGGAQVTGTSSSSTKLHTLSSNWTTSTKFALEASLASQGTNTSFAQLWDFTAGAVVSGSQVSTPSGSVTVVRSGQFTLIPGRQYGVTQWTSTTNAGVSTDVSLIVFP